MSNIHVLKGGDYDVTTAARKAEAAGVSQGIVIGFDGDGRLFFSGFGNCSMERTVFMMEGVKHDIFNPKE